MVTIAICICAMDRPRLLERCLESIALGSRLPAEVVVSDDTTETAVAAQMHVVCEKYLFVRYVTGPKRGLCANRNRVIGEANGSHLSLLDDDAEVGRQFVERAESLASESAGVILTGDVLENGDRLQSPTNPTFLGHFGRPVQPGDRLENINLNSNVFPRAAFDFAKFDERIGFGYEDTDLCAQLLKVGFRIIHCRELVNVHRPPGNGEYRNDEQAWQVERARFYTALRRYARWHPNLARAAAFALVAPVHLAFHSLRRGHFSRAASGWLWLGRDLARLRN